MQQRLMSDMRRAGAIAAEVANGNLAVNTDTRRADEVGDLLRALGAMKTKLAESMRLRMHTFNQSQEVIRCRS